MFRSPKEASHGIAYYDVYVSVNGGAFSLWQTHVTTTTAPFTGVDGLTYGFYGVATDNVGQRQAVPAAAQAVTMISDTTDLYLPLLVR